MEPFGRGEKGASNTFIALTIKGNHLLDGWYEANNVNLHNIENSFHEKERLNGAA